MTTFFRLEAPEAPWGDYGSILQNGMTAHLGRNSDGIVQLERTGPFIPPMTFPGIGDVIVTAQVRELLDGSGLTGFNYLPVSKARITRVDWHLWDRNAEEPAEYPEEGEPEGYVLDSPHCEKTAAALGVLWELCIAEGAIEVRRNSDESHLDTIQVRESTWSGIDFFRGNETACNYVTSRARHWLEDRVAGAARFTEVEVVP